MIKKSVRTYRNGNVAMPDIDRSNGESAIAGHSAMDGTMRQQSAVHIIRSIAGNGSNHVSGICKTNNQIEIKNWRSKQQQKLAEKILKLHFI